MRPILTTLTVKLSSRGNTVERTSSSAVVAVGSVSAFPSGLFQSAPCRVLGTTISKVRTSGRHVRIWPLAWETMLGMPAFHVTVVFNAEME